MRFLSKTQIWKDSCSCSDDVDSRPDVLIHKASRAFKIKMFRCQSSWSRRASYIYGNIKRLGGPPKFEKFHNCFSDTEIVDRPDAQVCYPDARARDSDYD